MLVITTNYPEKLDKALIIRVPGAARHHELRLGIGVDPSVSRLSGHPRLDHRPPGRQHHRPKDQEVEDKRPSPKVSSVQKVNYSRKFPDSLQRSSSGSSWVKNFEYLLRRLEFCQLQLNLNLSFITFTFNVFATKTLQLVSTFFYLSSKTEFLSGENEYFSGEIVKD